MDAPAFIARIQSAGFALEIEGDTLFVSPANRLTDPQRQFIRAHKPELLAALAGKPEAKPTALEVSLAIPPEAQPELDRLLSLPAGERLGPLVRAGYRLEFEGGALARVLPRLEWPQPEPPTQHRPEQERAPTGATGGGTGMVRCADCAHAEATGHPVLVLCRAGCPPPACGMFWGSDPRHCARFAPATALTSTSEATR